MTYATVPTVANGDSWSAAQHNTYLRDNLAAVWPYTTAGDLAYASAANQLARLGIGTSYKFLQSIGGVPVWGGLQFCSVYHSTTQDVGTGSATAIVFDSEHSDVQAWHSTSSNTSRITVAETGFYKASIYLTYAGLGGSGLYWDTLEFRRNGTTVCQDRRLQQVDAYSKMFAVETPILSLSATQYMEIFLEQNTGNTRPVYAYNFSLWRVG